jgi:hypothetical protein
MRHILSSPPNSFCKKLSTGSRNALLGFFLSKFAANFSSISNGKQWCQRQKPGVGGARVNYKKTEILDFPTRKSGLLVTHAMVAYLCSTVAALFVSKIIYIGEMGRMSRVVVFDCVLGSRVLCALCGKIERMDA